MTSTYTNFTEQYNNCKSDLATFLSKYNQHHECPTCNTQLDIAQIHITHEWDCININIRAYCSQCSESRNYNTIIN